MAAKIGRRLYCSFVGPQPPDMSSITVLRQQLTKHVTQLKAKIPDDPAKVKVVDQKSLDHRSMEDSWDRVVLPLKSEPSLQLKYLSSFGNIRFGKILEDLDTFAVWLSYRHNQGMDHHKKAPHHHPMSVFTASVDRIDLHPEPIPMDRDLIFEGHVSWVGRSSLETTMRLLDPSSNKTPILDAKFVMVALHPTTRKSVAMHPIKTRNNTEEKIVNSGAKAGEKRRHEEEKSLFKTPPTPEETKIHHQLFLKTIDNKAHTFQRRVLPENSVWMEDCKLKNLIICHPEQRNLYNKIFGGFLMRQAYELAWANARVFSKSTPKTLVVDDIIFKKSVEVGSLLFLSSEICYTEGPYMQARVNAEVVDPEKGSRDTTNIFNFTFSTRDGSQVSSVVPKTYSDGMLYLSGKRSFDHAIHSRTDL